MGKTYLNSAQTNEFESKKFETKLDIINSNSADRLAEPVSNEASDHLISNGDQIADVEMYNKNNTDSNNIKKNVQTNEQNAEFARRRRENEMREKIEQAKADAVIEALDGINPLTNERITSIEDVKKFLDLKNKSKNESSYFQLDSNSLEKKNNNNDEIEVKNLQNIENNPQKIAKNGLNSENSNIIGNQSESGWQEILDSAERQKREYLLSHTEEEYVSLMKNNDFLSFVSDKSNMSLEDKQAKYDDFVKKIEQNAKLLASQILANKLSSPGALRTDTPVEPSYLSREQVENMSSQEIHENYDKIKRSMKHWK